jgi:hypothetical protein
MQITVEITRDDYAAFGKYVMDVKVRKTYFWVMFFVANFMVLLANLLQKQQIAIIIVQVVIFNILLLVITQVVRWLNNYLMKTIPMKNGAVLGKKTYTITDEGLGYTDGASTGVTQWSALRSVEETKTHTFLFIDAMMAFILPNRAFASEAARNEFIQVVRGKMQK